MYSFFFFSVRINVLKFQVKQRLCRGILLAARPLRSVVRSVAEPPLWSGPKGHRDWHSPSTKVGMGWMKWQQTVASNQSVTPASCQSSQLADTYSSPRKGRGRRQTCLEWCHPTAHECWLTLTGLIPSLQVRETEKQRRGRKSIHLFTYGKVANSLQALC